MISNFLLGGVRGGECGPSLCADSVWSFMRLYFMAKCYLNGPPVASWSTECISAWRRLMDGCVARAGRMVGWWRHFVLQLFSLWQAFILKSHSILLAASASHPRLVGQPAHRTWILSVVSQACLVPVAGGKLKTLTWYDYRSHVFHVRCLAET